MLHAIRNIHLSALAASYFSLDTWFLFVINDGGSMVFPMAIETTLDQRCGGHLVTQELDPSSKQHYAT